MAFLFLILVDVLNALLNGFVLSKLWSWFFVPILSLPSLSVPQAIGIAVVVNLLTRQYQHSEADVFKRILGMIIDSVVQALYALIFGWVLHLIM